VNEVHTIGAGSTSNVHVSNDTLNKKPVWLVDMSAIARGTTDVRLYDWFDSITAGDELGVQNLKMDTEGGLPDGGTFNVYKNSTFTPTNGSYPIGKTGNGGPPSAENVRIYPTQIEPDRDLIVEIENTGGTEIDVVTTMLFLESY
jgi:hypothetical protein